MKKLLLSTIAFILVFELYGQFGDVYGQKRNELEYRNAALSIQFQKRGEMVTYSLNEIEGLPYFSNDFVNGEIYTKNDSVKSLINYNAFLDAFEFKRNQNTYILVNNFDIRSIKFIDKTFKYLEYTNQNIENKYGYFEELIGEGKCKLYKKYKKSFVEPVVPETPFHEPKPAKFSDLEIIYYILSENEKTLIELNTESNKRFVKAFADNSEVILEYIKSSNLKINNEINIINIINYFNSNL